MVRVRGARGRPLVVTRDEELLDQLLRLADAGGVEVSVAIDALSAEDAWVRAPLVVVGADRVAELTRRALPPRLAVVLVAGPDRAREARLWAEAGALQAEHVAVLPQAGPWLVARFAQYASGGGARAATVVVAGVRGAGGDVAVALARAAVDRGLATLLVTATGQAFDTNGGGEGLAAVSIDPRADVGVASRALAAALRAAQPGRDLVVVDLPGMVDDASLLAFTSADRGYLVVEAQVRDCAAANRLAAVARRHCPTLSLVVRAQGARGLRPVEVAEALNLPLTGVLPSGPVPSNGSGPAGERDPLDRLCRRLLSDARGRRAARVGAGVARGVTS